MSGDPYAKSARWYDSLIEPFARKIRMIGMRMFPAQDGMSVLDVGCGTGTHLDIYKKAGCEVFGIDSSSAMLDIAQAKLGERTEHFRNYREFMANRGLPPLIAENRLLVDKKKIISVAPVGLYLLHLG